MMTTRQLIELCQRIETHHGQPVEVYFSDHGRSVYYEVDPKDLKTHHKNTSWYFSHKTGKASIPIESYQP